MSKKGPKKVVLYLFQNNLRWTDNPSLYFCTKRFPDSKIIPIVLLGPRDFLPGPGPYLRLWMKISWAYEEKIPVMFYESADDLSILLTEVKKTLNLSAVVFTKSIDPTYFQTEEELINICLQHKIGVGMVQGATLWDSVFEDNVYYNSSKDIIEVYSSNREFAYDVSNNMGYFVELLRDNVYTKEHIDKYITPTIAKSTLSIEKHLDMTKLPRLDAIVSSMFAGTTSATTGFLKTLEFPYGNSEWRFLQNKVGINSVTDDVSPLSYIAFYNEIFTGSVIGDTSGLPGPGTLHGVRLLNVRNILGQLSKAYKNETFGLNGFAGKDVSCNHRIALGNVSTQLPLYLSLGFVSVGSIVSGTLNAPGDALNNNRRSLLSWVFAREHSYHKFAMMLASKKYKYHNNITLYLNKNYVGWTDSLMFYQKKQCPIHDTCGGKHLQSNEDVDAVIKATKKKYISLQKIQELFEKEAGSTSKSGIQSTYPSIHPTFSYNTKTIKEQLRICKGILPGRFSEVVLHELQNVQDELRVLEKDIGSLLDIKEQLSHIQYTNTMIPLSVELPRIPDPAVHDFGIIQEPILNIQRFVSINDDTEAVLNDLLKALNKKMHNYTLIAQLKINDMPRWSEGMKLVIPYHTEESFDETGSERTVFYNNLLKALLNCGIRGGNLNDDSQKILGQLWKSLRYPFKKLLAFYQMFIPDVDYLSILNSYKNTGSILMTADILVTYTNNSGFIAKYE